MNPKPQPPRWTQRLLRWLHPADTLEEVEGQPRRIRYLRVLPGSLH
ncbi:hypothetical protein [Spirosoma horti]